MNDETSGAWDGQERRKSPRLRQLLDRFDDRITELHNHVVILSTQMTHMREELDELRRADERFVGR